MAEFNILFEIKETRNLNFLSILKRHLWKSKKSDTLSLNCHRLNTSLRSGPRKMSVLTNPIQYHTLSPSTSSRQRKGIQGL